MSHGVIQGSLWVNRVVVCGFSLSWGLNHEKITILMGFNGVYVHSPPARRGLLDFMSVAWSSSSSSSSSFSSSSSRCPPRPPAQLRLAIHSVLCRTSTTTIHAQCSLPDLNHDHPRPVFPAGPQPRPSTPSVPCRTSTASIPAQCSLPDLNHDHPRPVFPAGPQPRVSTPKDMPHRVPEDMPDRM